MPDLDPTSSPLATGVTTITLFGLLVGLTKWIGGNFSKQVVTLTEKLDAQTLEHKKELCEIKIAHEDCLKKHSETRVELATLKGRMSAIDGKGSFEVRSDTGVLHDKN